MSRVHTYSTRFLAALLMLLGVAIMISTVVRGGGPLSYGVVAGLGITAFGAARLYLSGAMRDER